MHLTLSTLVMIMEYPVDLASCKQDTIYQSWTRSCCLFGKPRQELVVKCTCTSENKRWQMLSQMMLKHLQCQDSLRVSTYPSWYHGHCLHCCPHVGPIIAGACMHLWSGHSPCQLASISIKLTGHMFKTYLWKHVKALTILFVCLWESHWLAKSVNKAGVDLQKSGWPPNEDEEFMCDCCGGWASRGRGNKRACLDANSRVTHQYNVGLVVCRMVYKWHTHFVIVWLGYHV